MESFGLGKIIPDGVEHPRDSIHIAIAQVTAGEDLKRGDKVGFIRGGVVGKVKRPIGVVDPYLDVEMVMEGQDFWIYLNPGSITTLVHHWTHPAFLDRDDSSIKWVTNYAQEVRLSYDELMDAADAHVRTGAGYCGGAEMEGVYTSDMFWEHYQIIRGRKLKDENKGNFFRCAC